MRFFCSRLFWTAVVMLTILGVGHAAATEVRRTSDRVYIKDPRGTLVLLPLKRQEVTYKDGDRGVIVPLENNIFSVGILESDCLRGAGRMALITDGEIAAFAQFGPESSDMDRTIVAEVCRLFDLPKQKHLM